MRRTILVVSVLALLIASCGSETDEGRTRTTGAAEASASDSASKSPSGVTVDDLVGTWIGELVEPAAQVTWSLRVAIRECDLSDECGDFRGQLQKGSMSCESTLTFEGTEDSALMFEETIGPCFASRMVFVPMPSGYAIGVEEYGEDAWYSYGARLNKNHRIGYP